MKIKINDCYNECNETEIASWLTCQNTAMRANVTLIRLTKLHSDTHLVDSASVWSDDNVKAVLACCDVFPLIPLSKLQHFNNRLVQQDAWCMMS